MANWQNVIDLSRKWEDGDIKEICKDAIRDLKKMNLIGSIADIRDELVERFEDLPADNVEEFDCALNELYDFGDVTLDGQFGGKKLAWIKTLF